MAIDFERGSSESITWRLGSGTVTEPLTLACWFKGESTGNFMSCISICNSPDNDESYELTLGNAGSRARAVVRVADDANTYTAAASSPTLSNGTWYHLAAVFHSQSSREIFVDGTSKATNSADHGGSISATLNDYGIGCRNFEGSSGKDNFLDGVVAEAAIWERALSDGEIAALAAGFSPRFFPGYKHHFDLIRTIHDHKRATGTITTTGTAVVDHYPGIVYPVSVQKTAKATAAGAGDPIPMAMHYYRSRRTG